MRSTELWGHDGDSGEAAADRMHAHNLVHVLLLVRSRKCSRHCCRHATVF